MNQTVKSEILHPKSKITYAWLILIVVYFASLAAPLNQFKVPPILPVLTQAFQINLTQGGLLMSVLALTGMVLALPAGVIQRRFGPRAGGLVALGLMGAGSAFGALSTGYTALLASRVIEGLGIGLIAVIAPATIAMWFPRQQRGAPMGIWATWMPVGSAIMFNLAPWLTASYGWQSVWRLTAGYCLAMIIVYGLLVRRPPAAAAESARSAESFSFFAALANRDIWLLGLAFACFNLIFLGEGTYYPTFLNQARGLSLGQAAFIASLSRLTVLFSAPATGWLSDRLGSPRWLLRLPFLVAAMLFVLLFRLSGWPIILLMIVQGLLMGALPTITFTTAPAIMRKAQLAGLGLGVVLVGQYLGQLLGPVLFGELVRSQSWVIAGYAMIPIALLGFLSAWFVRVP